MLITVIGNYGTSVGTKAENANHRRIIDYEKLNSAEKESPVRVIMAYTLPSYRD